IFVGQARLQLPPVSLGRVWDQWYGCAPQRVKGVFSSGHGPLTFRSASSEAERRPVGALSRAEIFDVFVHSDVLQAVTPMTLVPGGKPATYTS
ncbi:hypothetical protein MCOR31_006765, partial [Pyricularia oryzae]